MLGLTGLVAGALTAGQIGLVGLSGVAEPLTVEDLRAGDGAGCFRTPLSLATLTETYRLYDAPRPAAPGLACFDAPRLAQDLGTGAAVAFLSAHDIRPGFDRVVAIYPDGRAYAWQQPSETVK